MEPDLQIIANSYLLDSWVKYRNSLNWDLKFQRNSFRNIRGCWLLKEEFQMQQGIESACIFKDTKDSNFESLTECM